MAPTTTISPLLKRRNETNYCIGRRGKALLFPRQTVLMTTTKRKRRLLPQNYAVPPRSGGTITAPGEITDGEIYIRKRYESASKANYSDFVNGYRSSPRKQPMCKATRRTGRCPLPPTPEGAAGVTLAAIRFTRPPKASWVSALTEADSDRVLVVEAKRKAHEKAMLVQLIIMTIRT